MHKHVFKKFISIFYKLAILVLICSGHAYAQTETRQISHLGGTTAITGIPKKVVALEFSFVDNLYQLGIKPVGIADDGDSKRIIEPIRSALGTYTSLGKRAQPNLEALQLLKPDLIIADAKRHTEIYKELQAIAPTILLRSLQGNFQELEESFKVIASVFQQEKQAQEVINKAEQHIQDIKSALTNTAFAKLSVLMAVPENQFINAHTSASFLGNILDKMGIKQNIVSNNVYEEMTLEQLVNKQPDIIIYIRKSSGTIVDMWKQNPLYQSIPAVKNGHIFEVDTEVWSRFRGYQSLNVISNDIENIRKGLAH